MVNVEFSRDVYINPEKSDEVIKLGNDGTIKPSLEIALHETPREIERKVSDVLLFKDLKPYLSLGQNCAIVNREDWSYEVCTFKNELPACYDDMFVYGIGMRESSEEDDEKWLMFNAKFSSAYEVYESIYRQARSSIYVVDNYIGLRTLVHLKNSPTGVNIILFSDNVGNNKLHNIEYIYISVRNIRL